MITSHYENVIRQNYVKKINFLHTFQKISGSFEIKILRVDR